MLGNITTAFPAPSTCERDRGVQHLVASRRSVPFLRIGCVARIEVVGIPALRCQVCNEQVYDLALLAHIERVLLGRVAQGQFQTWYRFEQLAAEITADALPL
ncbi:MAG: hypothetical protein ACRDOE_01700 [Streptosporangiaceae bacterium]